MAFMLTYELHRAQNMSIVLRQASPQALPNFALRIISCYCQANVRVEMKLTPLPRSSYLPTYVLLPRLE